MQISDQLSVIGFFWWYPYRISVHAKIPYRYSSTHSWDRDMLYSLLYIYLIQNSQAVKNAMVKKSEIQSCDQEMSVMVG